MLWERIREILTQVWGFQVLSREDSSICSSGSDSDPELWLLSPQMSAQPDGVNEHPLLSEPDWQKMLDFSIKLDHLKNPSAGTWKYFWVWCKKEGLTRGLTECCAFVVWKWEVIVLEGRRKASLGNVPLFQVDQDLSWRNPCSWGWFYKRFQQANTNPRLLSAQRVWPFPKENTFPPKLEDWFPPKGFLWILTLPALGRSAEVFSAVTLQTAFDFTWRIQENEKTSMGIAVSTGAPNLRNLSQTLDSSSCTGMFGGDQGQNVTVLWHRTWQCSVQGNGASRWPGFQWIGSSRLDQNSSSDKWILMAIKSIFLSKVLTMSGVFQAKSLMESKDYSRTNSLFSVQDYCRTIVGPGVLIPLWGLPQNKFSCWIHRQIQARIAFSLRAVKFLHHLSSLHRGADAAVTCPGGSPCVPAGSWGPQECPLQQRWIFLNLGEFGPVLPPALGIQSAKLKPRPSWDLPGADPAPTAAALEGNSRANSSSTNTSLPLHAGEREPSAKGVWAGLYSVNEFPPNPIETLPPSVYH